MKKTFLALILCTFLFSCSKFDGRILSKETDCKIEYYDTPVTCDYLENTSKSKKLKFTVKTSATLSGNTNEYFHTYTLEPGEKKEVGSEFFYNGPTNRITQKFEITGQQELQSTE